MAEPRYLVMAHEKKQQESTVRAAGISLSKEVSAGYARVPSQDQHLDLQINAPRSAGGIDI